MTMKRPDRILGPGHDEFWQWCERQELRLQRCDDCGKLAWPVVQRCEHCGNQRFQWQAMSGKGRLVSWCRFDQDYYRGTLKLPYWTILVELEEGPLFVSNPVDIAEEELAAGLAVRLTFQDCEDDRGAFKLPVFEKS